MILLLLLSSCEAYLDKILPDDQIYESVFWKDEEDIKIAKKAVNLCNDIN